jgi:RNA 2',3'-cyclic 3'-phosphodiesterase
VSTVRVFVAVEMPPPVRDAIVDAVAPVRAAWPSLGWVAPVRWHLTLTFCGDVTTAQVDALVPRLERAAARTEPFNLALDGLGRFGHRVLHTSVHCDLAALRRLAARTAAASRRAGVEVPNERYHPHVTLARARQRVDLREVVAMLPSLDVPTWMVTDIVLVHSVIGPDPAHETVARLPLHSFS